MTSIFRAGAAGYVDWFASSSFPGPSVFSGVSSTIFVFYLNDLPSKVLSSTSSISSL